MGVGGAGGVTSKSVNFLKKNLESFSSPSMDKARCWGFHRLPLWKGYNLPGVTTGPNISFLKWVKKSETTDFPEFSICLRCDLILPPGNPLETTWKIYRINPSRIDSTETILAAVMNGRGNGNKDEVLSFKKREKGFFLLKFLTMQVFVSFKKWRKLNYFSSSF